MPGKLRTSESSVGFSLANSEHLASYAKEDSNRRGVEGWGGVGAVGVFLKSKTLKMSLFSKQLKTAGLLFQNQHPPKAFLATSSMSLCDKEQAARAQDSMFQIDRRPNSQDKHEDAGNEVGSSWYRVNGCHRATETKRGRSQRLQG